MDIELVCASNLPVQDLREQLDADLFDRLSHLIVLIPPLRECRDDLQGDWFRVWKDIRIQHGVAETAPWTQAIESVLKQHDLPGNLRDLQRLAVLSSAWWSDENIDTAVDQALEEWSQWTVNGTVGNTGFGSGSRTERIKWFSARLARWSKEQYKTWSAAGKVLGCNEKTLRQDASWLNDRE